MKKLILLKLIIVSALCMSLQANAAKVTFVAGYQDGTEFESGSYTFVSDGEIVGSGDIAQVMSAELLNQQPGDYTAVITLCNAAWCDEYSQSYTVQDAPNIDDLELTITVSRD
jgi:hypothetical protein